MTTKKVTIVGHRGTEAHEAEVGEQNWAGDSYRKVQQDSLKIVPKNTTLHLGRGVRTTTAGEIPEPQPRPSTEGMTRVTNRGTSSRASKNTGTKN
ncbi:MAG: hypothetical protein IIA20_00805 [Thaumarchaeota archaeon]|nr:hypothetical protein [Nitrososphaerota archaeon]